MIIIIVAALVVLGVLGIGGMIAYKKLLAQPKAGAPAAAPAAEAPVPEAKDAKDDDDDEDTGEKGGEEKEGGGGPAVMQLNKMIVNLDGPRKNAFLKADIHILFRNQELGKLAASDKPTPENSIIKSIVLEALSGKTVDVASDVETREAVRQDIKDKLNEKFANKHSKAQLEKAKKTGKPVKPPIKDVLVVDWAIQQ
jgi:flagellar basal body-associated protein FliL